jgi:serine/threonine protein kinase
VKRSNTIFVNGLPKLADIGLVASAQGAKSFAGTEGFIPPEGPGTPQADIFSLGKAIYQSATGCEPNRYPGLPTSLTERTDGRELMRLMEIVNKACANFLGERYQSAEELRDDLKKLGASLQSL